MRLVGFVLTVVIAFFAPHSHGDLVNFHFGALTSTGPAVVGSPGDHWNAAGFTNGGPLLLQNAQGLPTPFSVSWTSGDAWAATKSISSSTGPTAMDPATNWLMRSCASSYQYKPGVTNLRLNLSGLSPGRPYTLVLLAAGSQKGEGTQFFVTGTGTFTGSTTGLDRKISSGSGDAYAVIQVVSSSTGTLSVTAAKNGYSYAVLNGFQLELPSTLAWGVCGHPTWSDYANWNPANVTTQIGYIKQLGCGYYRCSFEGASYPSILDNVVPATQASGTTVLPILPLSLIAANGGPSNYSANYQIGYTWASYAISKGYALPYWELGNELENFNLIDVTYDGASPNDYPDATPGGFAAIAFGLKGAYQGIKDAYSAGRKSGQTSITPQVLYGATFRHWGLLTKIMNTNGSLPCDIISWHWYGPNYGPFNAAIVDANSVSNGRTPAQCLNDFKKTASPGQPMDIWITETDRSASTGGSALLNGSVASNATPRTSQDWAAQAQAIQTNIDSFKAVPSVKAIFVYELLDETLMNSGSVSQLASDGYFGLVTKLNGTPKDAFYTFQTEIRLSK